MVFFFLSPHVIRGSGQFAGGKWCDIILHQTYLTLQLFKNKSRIRVFTVWHIFQKMLSNGRIEAAEWQPRQCDGTALRRHGACRRHCRCSGLYCAGALCGLSAWWDDGSKCPSTTASTTKCLIFSVEDDKRKIVLDNKNGKTWSRSGVLSVWRMAYDMNRIYSTVMVCWQRCQRCAKHMEHHVSPLHRGPSNLVFCNLMSIHVYTHRSYSTFVAYHLKPCMLVQRIILCPTSKTRIRNSWTSRCKLEKQRTSLKLLISFFLDLEHRSSTLLPGLLAN